MSANIAVELEKEATNRNAKAFIKNIGTLQSGLSSTIATVAANCFSKELIPRTVYRVMFNDQWSPEHIRAQYFLDCVLKRLEHYEETKPGAVRETITTLASIVRSDSALEHIATEIGKRISCYNNCIVDLLDSCFNAGDFQKKLADLSTGIQAALTSIAMGATSKGIITFYECQACTDGNATAEERQTRMVLYEIFKGINHNPNVLDKFLAILEKMGPPISNYCQPISNNNNNIVILCFNIIHQTGDMMG